MTIEDKPKAWENNDNPQWVNIKLKFEHYLEQHKKKPFYDLDDHDCAYDFFFKNMKELFHELAIRDWQIEGLKETMDLIVTSDGSTFAETINENALNGHFSETHMSKIPKRI